jgi:NAD-dependent deacetylase
MSAESGIPTFRDALTGLWERFDATALASPQGYLADPSLVWGWYEWRRMKVMQAVPNAGQFAIADFVRNNPTKFVEIITQNVDDLHERAGCADVTHLHGSILAPRCFVCERPANAALIEAIPNEPEGGRHLAPPRCDHCDGTLRPGVVWFGESLPQAEFKHASNAAREAEVIIVIGTSGVVEPAASLVRIAKEADAFIISIDPNETMAGRYADAADRDRAARALQSLLTT